MPIQVTCPTCHKRFKVSDKFAGKSGPCPSCKATIQVPEKGDEVVIHSAEDLGPKDASGKSVLKPIERKEVTLTPVMSVGIVGVVLGTLIVALILRSNYKSADVPQIVLAVGAVVLAPPAVLAGYSFLRNDELEPYRGGALAIRALICAAVYAGLWGGYALLKSSMFHGQPPEMFHLVFIGPVLLAVGAFAAQCCLDLDFGTGVLHYGFYLLVTVLLRWLVGAGPY
jgi:hypothetical protein